MKEQVAIIIGAGPAGLTAAYELATRTNIKPIVLEQSQTVGGLSRSIDFQGNKLDIGGHRFFSKSERVLDWWFQFLPVENTGVEQHDITYRNATHTVDVTGNRTSTESADDVMLVRKRRSRIYSLRKFFDYPLKPTLTNLKKLGFARACKVLSTLAFRRLFPIRPVENLEHFLINQFGDEIYKVFFKDHTAKVWGRQCSEISASWGAQRIKALDISGELGKWFNRLLSSDEPELEMNLLMEQFFYPKFGPGQMWDIVADVVRSKGGEIKFGMKVEQLDIEAGRAVSVVCSDSTEAKRLTYLGNYFFTSMPVRSTIRSISPAAPGGVKSVAEGLEYRDLVLVGLVVETMKVGDERADGSRMIDDNWVYVQDPAAQVGRLQVYNNWSPYMVAGENKVFLGLEYFCDRSDPLWQLDDSDIIDKAADELALIGLIDRGAVIDGAAYRISKTYPAYTGTYKRFGEVVEYLQSIENLFPVGRNGMHKYNNQDHAMLTAMISVDNIIEGRTDKSNIWDVNTEQDYIEEDRGADGEA